MEILGIDIGGSGIKGAPVNIETGKLVSERKRVPTPDPSSPENVATTLIDIVKHFNWTGLVGSGFPAVVNNGKIFTASNIDKKWIGTNASSGLGSRLLGGIDRMCPPGKAPTATLCIRYSSTTDASIHEVADRSLPTRRPG